jgi:hypothetical protein
MAPITARILRSVAIGDFPSKNRLAGGEERRRQYRRDSNRGIYWNSARIGIGLLRTGEAIEFKV